MKWRLKSTVYNIDLRAIEKSLVAVPLVGSDTYLCHLADSHNLKDCLSTRDSTLATPTPSSRKGEKEFMQQPKYLNKTHFVLTHID